MTWGASVQTIGPPILEGEDEFALKLEYARIVAENPSQWQIAGYQVFPGEENRGRALQSQAWYYDSVVQMEIVRLRRSENVESPLAPSDEEILQHAWEQARSPRIEPKDQVAYLKLLMEARGMVGKPSTINNNNVVGTQAVLMVPERVKTIEEQKDYFKRFKESQLKLVADAKSSRN